MKKKITLTYLVVIFEGYPTIFTVQKTDSLKCGIGSTLLILHIEECF